MVRPAQRGFAYLMLMIAIALIGIVAANTVQVGYVQGQRDMEEELLAIGIEYQRALTRYADATPGGLQRSPRSVEELLRDPRYPGVVRHLRRAYTDPLSGQDNWNWVRDTQGLIIGVHSNSPRKPIREKDFGPALQHLEDRRAASYREWIFWGPHRPVTFTQPGAQG